jgi:hypothetical protein
MQSCPSIPQGLGTTSNRHTGHAHGRVNPHHTNETGDESPDDQRTTEWPSDGRLAHRRRRNRHWPHPSTRAGEEQRVPIPVKRLGATYRVPVAPVPASHPRKELIARLGKRECELCEQGRTVSVHQVAKLADLGKPGPGQPAWAKLMARMRRKTLIVCAACHENIHATPVTHAA